MPTFLKRFINFAVVGALFAPSLLVAGQLAGVNPSSSQLGNETLQVINEIPAGAINGWNTEFRLSHVPQPNSPVHFYRNGVLLVDPTDYQVRSSAITVSPNQVPQVGDMLNVLYVGADAAMRSIGSLPSAPSSGRYLDEISIAATRNALRDERISLSISQDGSSTDRRLHLRQRLNQPEQPGLDALQMLSARLADKSPDVTDGVEGLGDATSPSVYTHHRAGVTNSRSLPAERHRSSLFSQSPDHPSSSRAIEMLEGRLEANDPHQLDSIASSLDSRQRRSLAIHDGDHRYRWRESRASRSASSDALNLLNRQLSNEGQLNVSGGINGEK